jgi:hypothetical protein
VRRVSKFSKRLLSETTGKSLGRKLSRAEKNLFGLKGKPGSQKASRRRFLQTATAAGATIALADEAEAHKRPRRTERRTLFFNLSHEDYEGRTYYLIAGKEQHRLKRAHHLHPSRRANRFLAALPDSAITHVVDDVELPANQVILSFTLSNPQSDGSWSMSSFFLTPPLSSLEDTYRKARNNLLEGEPLPLSVKRMKYGLPPAMTLQDLVDEQALLDSTDWAKAMVNVNPELLSADPNSASHIQNNLIDARSTFQLSQQLEMAGPALPAQSSSATVIQNSTGWATLVPYTDEDGVTPLRINTGNNLGRILYDAKWQPSINTFVAAAVKPTSSAVKNDAENLGADITGGPASLQDVDLTGKIWFRNDGQASVTQTPTATGTRRVQDPGEVNYTLTNINPIYNGYGVTSSTTVSGDTVTVTLNFTNWYLRWLALYIRFQNGPNVVPTANIPSGISASTVLDTPNETYLGVLTPEFTIYGVPVQNSKNQVTFQFPTSVASSAAVLASGLGYGSHTFPDTERIGVIMTSIFNLAVPALMLAYGLGTAIDLFLPNVLLPFVPGLIADIFAIAAGATPTQAAAIFWRTMVNGAKGPFLSKFIPAFLTFLAEQGGIEAAEDAIPIAGVILQAIGAIGTLAEITETSCEVLLSPWTYQYQLVGTHDLSVALVASDPAGFPAGAATYTTMLVIDGGTPYVQAINAPSTRVQTLPPVVFQSVPLGGGNFTVSIGFYTADNQLIGTGSTSGINDVNAAPSITVTEVQVAITSSTVYQHAQKTSLDVNANHVWVCGPAPAAPATPSACESNPGDLCAFRNITVSALGYVGYGWQSYINSGCASGGAGQLDQMSNIFVANGSGGNAQIGYATLPCALEPGAKLIYDPIGQQSANYYLDSSNGNYLVRQIQLDPPGFADPRSNVAWGKFNLSPDDLLFHPAGALVSINSVNSRMESLRLPSSAATDAQAGVSLLANLHGGQGNRPGLFLAPTATTITADGVILILESGNNRIHALDLGANPVRHFANQPTQYFLNLSATGGATTTYLDIAVEYSGFIYILSFSGGVYRLDIYSPDQSGTNPISTTMGFNAAKVTVDYWRTVYSLNYEVLTVPGGSVPNGVTEPSISQWFPFEPPPCAGEVPHPKKPKRRGQQAAVTMPRRLLRRNFWRLPDTATTNSVG